MGIAGGTAYQGERVAQEDEARRVVGQVLAYLLQRLVDHLVLILFDLVRRFIDVVCRNPSARESPPGGSRSTRIRGAALPFPRLSRVGMSTYISRPGGRLRARSRGGTCGGGPLSPGRSCRGATRRPGGGYVIVSGVIWRDGDLRRSLGREGGMGDTILLVSRAFSASGTLGCRLGALVVTRLGAIAVRWWRGAGSRYHPAVAIGGAPTWAM